MGSPLDEALEATAPAGRALLIDELFAGAEGDDDWRDDIVAKYQAGVSLDRLAAALSNHFGRTVSSNALNNWLRRQPERGRGGDAT